jgi:K+-transporting ATPase KdpF subunit
MSGCATTPEREGITMTLDLWLAALTALGLLLYLVAVLVRPERF